LNEQGNYNTKYKIEEATATQNTNPLVPTGRKNKQQAAKGAGGRELLAGGLQLHAERKVAKVLPDLLVGSHLAL